MKVLIDMKEVIMYHEKLSAKFGTVYCCLTRTLLIALLLIVAFPPYVTAQEGDLIDYSRIALLRWVDPEPPDAYDEYLIRHPRLPLRIMTVEPPVPHIPPVIDVGNVLIFVNNAIYSGIETNLDRYILDIQAQGYNISMFLWTSGTVEDLKTTIQTNSTNLVGCVFVGEFPCAWYEIENDFEGYYTGNGIGGYGYGYTSFPCDLFLMDIDGEWRDDENTAPMQAGVYDTHVDGSGDVGPEIFIGRIDASKITDDTEENLLNDYFDKLHQFYTGGMTQTDLALTYTEDDWAASPSFWNDIDNAYPDNESIEAPDTDRDDYCDDRLDSPTYEFIQLACHSDPTGHIFTRGGWLNSNEVKAVPPDALFYNLFCCSALRFTTNNFLGAAYLFNASTTSLNTIGSTKTGSMLVFSAFYEPLGQGKSFGQAFQEWFNSLAPYSNDEISWHYGMTIIGDPLVTPCEKTDVDVVQVLDRSGSMKSTASNVSSDSKIEVLRFAADEFIQMMKPNIGNRLGLVQFNQDVVSFAPYNTDLQELITTPTDHVAHLRDAVASIVASGYTSIGDGLHKAWEQFNTNGDPENDHVILLVTDGKENRALWILDTQPDLIDDDIVVYSLGLGHGTGIDEVRLTDLASATGGSYLNTSDPLEFRKFFLDILAGAVNWAVIVDPIGKLGSREEATVPVTINSDQFCATFTAYWDDIDYAIDLSLVTPSGKEITPNDADMVRYVSHPRYAFYQLDFPLGGYLSEEWAGKWEMKLTGTNNIQTGEARYSASAYAEGGAKIESGFDKLHNQTGDRVRTWVKIVVPSFPSPPPAPTVIAYCNQPLEGVGNILHDFKYDPSKLQPSDTLADYNPITHKLDILRKQTGEDILPRGTTELILYDDGEHDDGLADDGLYANSFTDTRIQGPYTFRFIASGIPGGGGIKTTREWNKSFYNEVNNDPDYSIIDIKMISRAKGRDLAGWNYAVKVVPKDKFGNYWGPGLPVSVSIVYGDSSWRVNLNDNIDGTYTKDVFISQRELDQGAKLVVETDGKTFTTIEKLPTYLKWALSIHSGTAIPTGSFANDFDPGFNILLDADYTFSPQLSVVTFFGYNDLKSKTAGIDDNYWINLSANVRYRRPLNRAFSYYVGAGPGIYIPENGDTEFGANVGLGINYEYSPLLTFELGADYHTIFDPDIQFVHSHAGVIFRF